MILPIFLGHEKQSRDQSVRSRFGNKVTREYYLSLFFINNNNHLQTINSDV